MWYKNLKIKKHKRTFNCLSCICLKFMKEVFRDRVQRCVSHPQRSCLAVIRKQCSIHADLVSKEALSWKLLKIRKNFLWHAAYVGFLKRSRMKSLSTTHTVSNHTGFPVLEWKLGGSHVFLFLLIHSEKQRSASWIDMAIVSVKS